MQIRTLFDSLEITLIVVEYSLADFRYARSYIENDPDIVAVDDLVAHLAEANEALLLAIAELKKERFIFK